MKYITRLTPMEEFMRSSFELLRLLCRHPVPKGILFVCTVLLLVTAGCRAPIIPETETVWSQNLKTPMVWLIPASQGFCYLTRISGEFTNAADMVHVGVAPNPTNNQTYWEIDGTSNTKDVTATARCTSWSNFDMKGLGLSTPPWVNAAAYYTPPVEGTLGTPEFPICCPNLGAASCQPDLRNQSLPMPPQCVYVGGTPGSPGYWTSGRTDAQLSYSNSFCFLTGVRGALDPASTATVYTIIPGQPNLQHMLVVSEAHNQTLSGSAGCVAYSPVAVPDPRISVASWGQGAPPKQLISGAEGICFLTGIQGKFRGNGEMIEIQHDTNPISNVPMLLLGHSDQAGVVGEVQCIKYLQS